MVESILRMCWARIFVAVYSWCSKITKKQNISIKWNTYVVSLFLSLSHSICLSLFLNFFLLENSFSLWFFHIRYEYMLMTDCTAKKQKKKHDHDKKWTVYKCNYVGALNKVISNNYILLFFSLCASSKHTHTIGLGWSIASRFFHAIYSCHRGRCWHLSTCMIRVSNTKSPFRPKFYYRFHGLVHVLSLAFQSELYSCALECDDDNKYHSPVPKAVYGFSVCVCFFCMVYCPCCAFKWNINCMYLLYWARCDSRNSTHTRKSERERKTWRVYWHIGYLKLYSRLTICLQRKGAAKNMTQLL